MNQNPLLRRFATALAGLVVAIGAVVGLSATPASAASGYVYVTFGDWRCSATGGGSVVAVQMGSEYGSVPRTSGRTIRIWARTGANHLTGVVWCKRPWYRGGVTTPVYNISQGIWVDRIGQSFNV